MMIALVVGRDQLLREPDAAGANVEQLDGLAGHPSFPESSQDLDAESVVAAKDVAEAGDERARHAGAPARAVPTTTCTAPSLTRTGRTLRCSSRGASGLSSRCPVRTS